mmetsp:Transcript_7247/g.21128  ORF Transcript_7247/g.21128 Transcript_7247/m.21128 type:complete len:317 (+) Transcript_7247:1666-2616(+)
MARVALAPGPAPGMVDGACALHGLGDAGLLPRPACRAARLEGRERVVRAAVARVGPRGRGLGRRRHVGRRCRAAPRALCRTCRARATLRWRHSLSCPARGCSGGEGGAQHPGHDGRRTTGQVGAAHTPRLRSRAPAWPRGGVAAHFQGPPAHLPAPRVARESTRPRHGGPLRLLQSARRRQPRPFGRAGESVAAGKPDLEPKSRPGPPAPVYEPGEPGAPPRPAQPPGLPRGGGWAVCLRGGDCHCAAQKGLPHRLRSCRSESLGQGFPGRHGGHGPSASTAPPAACEQPSSPTKLLRRCRCERREPAAARHQRTR